jgi:hypothetical protein
VTAVEESCGKTGEFDSRPVASFASAVTFPGRGQYGEEQLRRIWHLLRRGFAGVPYQRMHGNHGTLKMPVATLVLITCAPIFAISEMATLRTVHVIDPLRATAVRLGAGTYALDQDPDATNFPASGDSLTITGPDGPVGTWEGPWDVSPTDLGGVFLGVGTFAQVARFTIRKPGIYRFAVAGPGTGARLLVTEPYGIAARDEGPWALAIVGAILTLGRHWYPGGRTAAAGRQPASRRPRPPVGSTGTDSPFRRVNEMTPPRPAAYG